MRTTSFTKTILPLFALLLLSCESDPIEPLNQPTVNETTLDNITYTSIEANGSTTPNDLFISSRGICWSTNPNPTINDNKTVEATNLFTSTIQDLIANTTYYYRVYLISNSETIYGEENTFSTLSLNNTDWNFTTNYPSPNDYTLYSKINFYDDGTTKYDELDIPGQAPGIFITFGTWQLDGNNLTYYFDSTDPSNPIYIYTGTISGMEINGNYTHTTAPNGTWSAALE